MNKTEYREFVEILKQSGKLIVWCTVKDIGLTGIVSRTIDYTLNVDTELVIDNLCIRSKDGSKIILCQSDDTAEFYTTNCLQCTRYTIKQKTTVPGFFITTYLEVLHK